MQVWQCRLWKVVISWPLPSSLFLSFVFELVLSILLGVGPSLEKSSSDSKAAMQEKDDDDDEGVDFEAD